MMNPYDKAHELAQAIQSHQAFRVLLSKKQELERSSEAKKIVEDFRRRQWEFESKRMMGQEVTADDQQVMQELQTALSLHTAARDFLQAEYQFGLMFQDIQKIIAESVKSVVDLPELPDM